MLQDGLTIRKNRAGAEGRIGQLREGKVRVPQVRAVQICVVQGCPGQVRVVRERAGMIESTIVADVVR